MGQTWEIYDPSSNSFPTTASAGHDLVDPQRALHAAAAFVDGHVLLAGGTHGTGGTTGLTSTEDFNPNPTAPAPLGFASGPTLLQLARFRIAASYAPAQNVLVLVGGNTVGPSTEQITTP